MSDTSITSDQSTNSISQKTTKKPKIRVYRQYITYHVLDAKTVEITKHFFMIVSSNVGLWVYPMDGYVSALKIVNSDGDSLPILSANELSYVLRSQARKELDITETTVTQDRLRKICQQQNNPASKQPTQIEILQAKHYVGIILPQINAEHFEEVIVKWIAPIDIEEKSNRKLNLEVGMQHVNPPTTASSTYLDIIMDDDKKYEIIGDTTVWADDEQNIKKTPLEGEEYRSILKTKTRQTYRIKRNVPTTYTIKWKVGIPKVVQKWAWIGFFISIGILSFSIFTFIENQQSFARNSAIVSGLIGLIIGLRVLLFHDTELMKRWNDLYLSLLIISVGIILGMAYFAK